MLGKREKIKIRTRHISPFNESCTLGLCVCVCVCVCARACTCPGFRNPMSKSWVQGEGGLQEAQDWHISGLIGWTLSSELSCQIQLAPTSTRRAERTRLVCR